MSTGDLPPASSFSLLLVLLFNVASDISAHARQVSLSMHIDWWFMPSLPPSARPHQSHAAVSGAGGSAPSTDTLGPRGATKGSAAKRSARAWAEGMELGPAVLLPYRSSSDDDDDAAAAGAEGASKRALCRRVVVSSVD